MARASLVTVILGIFLLPPLWGDDLSVGLTEKQTVIKAISDRGASTDLPTVLLIGGLDGDKESANAVTREVHKKHRYFRLVAIPLANPDGTRLVFPPTGVAYKENPESHYLWRWIGMEAPDLVLIAGKDEYGLAEALSQNAVAGVGRIPARSVEKTAGPLDSLPKDIPASDARREIERRLARSPREISDSLAKVYGHVFDEAVYIQGIALLGRLRLGNVEEVERLAKPYLDGRKDSLAKATASNFSGHLVFAELAERTGNPRYTELVRKAADLGFTDTGEMKESMPSLNEMSDGVFMGCPILAKAGKLTGERKYFDMAVQNLVYMQKVDLRPDGLYRHSPLAEAAWGRGNAFPAFGLALTLSEFPKDHAGYGYMLRSFQDHMAALSRFQDERGMWREVIDMRGAYSEFSATAMIADAMLRGIRNGWLDGKSYQPRVDRAWRAIAARIGEDGSVVDVCESTGKQKSLEDYLHRAAILGKDPRGGAMALFFATEMAGLSAAR